MFTIADGRDHFYQWDLNRQIIVSDPTVDEIHFCNKTDDCSLVLEVEEEVLAERLDGTKVIQRYVNVPNILLQDALPIRVYAFCVDYTKVEKIFKVCPRTKPADYIYTETEIKRWEDTVNKADETLDRANEVLDGANDIVLQAKEHADNASTSASNALESATNAKESETNAATSASNASKSATDALSNANKAKASELNAQAASLDAVAAKEDTEQLKTDVTNLKSDTESLKNTTQGFANDASNSAQIATTKANEASESATSAANTVEGFNEYVEGHKLEFTHDGNGAVTLEGVELNGLDNYYTKEETDQAIANVEVDLSEYYTKSETDTLLENVDADIVISDDGEGNVIIDAAPGSGEGGSSEGGAKVVILNNFSNSVTDEDRANVKELCEYYYSNNNTFPNNTYYVRYTNGELCIVEKIFISTSWNGGYEIYFYFFTEGDDKFNNYAQLNSDYSWNTGYLSNYGSSSKDWRTGYYDSYYASSNGANTNHMKITGYFDGNDQYQVTFDVSAASTNGFTDNSYYIHMPTVYINSNSYNISFYNDYGTLRVRDSDHNDYYNFTITACYYWG